MLLQSVGEIHPGPEVVGVEAGGAVQFLPAVLIGLQAGIRRLPHHAAEGIVVRHLLHGARLVEDHADVAQVVAEVGMVLRRAVGGEGDVALVGEQPALAAVIDHVSAVVSVIGVYGRGRPGRQTSNRGFRFYSSRVHQDSFPIILFFPVLL